MSDVGSHHQNERATQIIAHEAANFILREASRNSLITVVRAESTSHGDQVNVFVSIFPQDQIPSALSFLERQRESFSQHLKKHTHLRLPRINFLLDNNPPS